MTAISYPVAPNAEQALSRPLGQALRQKEAQGVAGEAVVFATDPTGPAFATLEGAEAAYRGPLAEGFARVSRQILPGQTVVELQPTNADGRRWPAPEGPALRTAWRLMVSYWRVATAARPLDTPQARQARRGRDAVDAETLKAIAQQPLRPVEPQKALDIGLFEARLPEAPHIIVPDE